MNKNNWIVAGVVVVVLLIIIGVSVHEHNKNKMQADTAASGKNAFLDGTSPDNATSTAATSTPPATGGGKTPAPSMAYTNAMAVYGANGHRIQFSQCHGTPGTFVIKQGLQFMLDNRDAVPHTVVVKSQTFHLAAYGFAIATAKDLGIYNITCDGGGAAQMNVEK